MTASQAESAALWVPTDVITHAKELILSSNYEKVPEARKNVDEILAQWVQVVEKATGDEKERGVAAIVELWGAYAALEVELRQFKQATKVFESAVSCPVSSTHVVLWLQYATFCIDRQKFSNARKVFVRALRTVPDHEHSPLWQQFHDFVVEHMDPNMTMPALQAQIFPDRPVVPVEATPAPPKAAAINDVAAASAPTPDVAVASAAAAPVANAAPTPVVEKPVPAVDPNLAFVDTKGSAYASDSVNGDAGPKKRAAEAQSSSTDAKRNRHDTVPVDGESQYFTHVPTTLPVTPGCPHLLFDADGSRREVDNELLERLSDVLGDSAVFQGVRDLHDNQRQRDRDMLFRWQDLVGMQMKEGSELFARHADVERNVTEPRDLIDLKTKHLEQRREFVHRCQMSQQQFIEICEMDRVGALRAQQISLENMKIPEMTVSTDPHVIGLQRAILNLILEAERLWREENAKPAPTATPKQQTPTKSAAPVSEKTSNISSRPRSDSRDRGKGGRGGRGGPSYGRRPGPPPRSSSPPRGGGRGPPRRDDSYFPAAHPHASARPHSSYDHPPSRHNNSSYQDRGRPQQPHHGPSGPAYDHSGRDRPDFHRPDFSNRHQDRRHPVHSEPPDWQHQSRYGGPPPVQTRGPQADPRFDAQPPYRRPSPKHDGRGGHGEQEYYGGPPHGGGSYGGPPPGRYGGEPVGPPQYSNAPPPNGYDYPPPSNAPFGYQAHQPIPQQHHLHHHPPPQQQPPQHAVYAHAPPPSYHQQPGYGAPPPVYQQAGPPQQLHHQPPQQHHGPPHQARNGGGGGGRFRRGGGGGGRYGRR